MAWQCKVASFVFGFDSLGNGLSNIRNKLELMLTCFYFGHPETYFNELSFESMCRNIVNWTLGKKVHWNLHRNLYICIQENAFENVVCCLGLNVLIPGLYYRDTSFHCLKQLSFCSLDYTPCHEDTCQCFQKVQFDQISRCFNMTYPAFSWFVFLWKCLLGPDLAILVPCVNNLEQLASLSIFTMTLTCLALT